MSAGCDYFIMEESCDCFDMIEYVQSFDMGINFLLGPPTPSEVVFIPSVDADGWLSWTNDGGLPNPEPVNIKGPPGSGAVESVNGKTGEVSLDAEDVGALPDNTHLFSGSYDDLTDKPPLGTMAALDSPLGVPDGGTGATTASAANASLHNYNLLEGVQIPDNTNLNTIVTPNIYRTTSDSNTASLVNKPPVTQPFQLAVMYMHGSSTVMQHVNEWLTGNEWRRFGYISGGSWTWGAWQKISATVKSGQLYESNISTSSGTIMAGSLVTYTYDNNFVSINYHIRLKDTTGRPTVTVTGLPNMGSGYVRPCDPTLVYISGNTGASDTTYAITSGTTLTINMTNFLGDVPAGTGCMVYSGSFVVPAAP